MMRKRIVAFTVVGLILAGCSDPLTTAVVSGDVKTLRTLLDDGADPDAFISFGHPKFAESSWPTGHRRRLDDAVAWERSRSIPSAVGVLSNIGEALL
jgi:hypothetical protein